MLQQPFHRPDLKNPLGQRGRHHPAPLRSILLEDPAFFAFQPVGFFFLIHRADKLGRVLEGRVVRIDFDHGQDGGKRHFEGQQVAHLLLDHIADHSLCLRPQHIQRISLDIFVGRSLERQQTYLRTIAVRQHELVLLGNRRQGLRCNSDIGALDIVGHRLATLEQGIST